jgi:inhibitor of KinA sporulation pathway (predicted exonuclease)
VEKDGYNTDIEYLVVLDFEATCEENKKLAPCSEIIEFPAIIVHTASAKRVAQFHQYVKPKYNPHLTAFCTQLTGITQDKVDAGKHLEQILEDFDAWIRSLAFMREDNWTFVTCGDWDLCNCLKTEAITKGIGLKNYFKSYINVKKYFSRVTRGS